MGRNLNETPLRARSERARLPDGLHWRALAGDVHLGYRKSGRSGSWLARSYCRARQRYRQIPLGAADDFITADGAATLSFAQAESRARQAVEAVRADALRAAAPPPLTVAACVENYIAFREERDHGRDARSRLQKHVLSKPIAARPLEELSFRDLRGWLEELELSDALKPASCGRLLNDFRAALNRTLSSDPDGFPLIAERVRNALKAPRDNAAHLPIGELFVMNDSRLARLLAAAREIDAAGGWEGDLYRLVLLLAATGARFSQLKRLKVADLQIENKRLMVPVSRKGSRRKSQVPIAYPLRDEVIAALMPCVAGRGRDAPLLERHKKVRARGVRSGWAPGEREPWVSASELNRHWDMIIARAGEAVEVCSYALRHTRIVACLRARLPTRLVASMHDTSVSIIEQTYAAYIVEALAEVAAGTAFAPHPLPQA